MNPNNLAEDIRLTQLAMDRRSLRQMDFASPAFLKRQSLKNATPLAWLWGGIALAAGIILFGLAKGWK